MTFNILSAFRDNKQFYLILLLIIFSAFASPLASTVLAISAFLLFASKLRLDYSFILFWMALILSDSRSGLYNSFGTLKIVFLLLIFILWYVNKKNYPGKNDFVVNFAPFAVVVLISTFYSDHFFLSAQKGVSYLLILFLIPLIFNAIFHQFGVRFLKQLISVIVLIILMGFIFYAISADLGTYANRYRGFLGNPNGLGVFCFLSYALMRILQSKFNSEFDKPEVALIYGLLILTLLLTQSRTALLGVLMLEGFTFLNRYNVVFSVLALLILVFAMEKLIALAPYLIVELGLEEFFRLETLEEASGRQIGWAFAWENIEKNFFLGKGFSFTERLYGSNYYYLADRGHQGNAHNTFLTIWLDTGLVGLIAFLFGWIRSGVNAGLKSKLALPYLFAVLFSVNFESWLAASLNPFTIVVVMTFTVLMLDEKKVNDQIKVNNSEGK